MHHVAEQAERITLTEASIRFRVPVPTLRTWLIKGWVTRHQGDDGRIRLDVEQLKKLLKDRRKQ